MQNDPNVVDGAVGPGALEDSSIQPDPTLQGVTEFQFVEILNPLTVPFRAIFGVTRPVRAESTVSSRPGVGLTHNSNDVRQNYGLDLNNPNFQGKANIQNRVTIPAGKTIRVLGNEAQVIVKQLVNEIMQREKNQLMLADAFQRNLVEKRIIINVGNVHDFMEQGPVSVTDQLQNAIKEPQIEEEFAGARTEENPGRVSGNQIETTEQPRRAPGRPPKAARA